MYVIIVGASKIGIALANLLSKEKHNVVIVEKDEDKARKLAEGIDALIVAGSGTEFETLKEAGAEKADVIVAATSHDEVNLMVCELARMLGIERMFTLSVNPKHENIFREIGVENIIYPSDTIASYLRNLILRPGISSVLTTLRDVDIIEMEIPENSSISGKTLKEVSIPEGSTIAAIYRDGQLIIPRGDSKIKGGDKVTALARVEVTEELTKILKGQK
jgi:trk system potassium uptake protein TrkA